MPTPTDAILKIVDITAETSISTAETAINDAIDLQEASNFVLISSEVRHQDVNNTMAILVYLTFQSATFLTPGAGDADNVLIDDAGGFFSSTDVEAALQEMAAAGFFALKKAITTTDLTVAAVVQVITFDAAIPAAALQHGALLRLDTEFSGGGAAVAQFELGDETDDDGYVETEDIFTGAVAELKPKPTTIGAFLLGNSSFHVDVASRTPQITVTSDVNVNTLTAGGLTAWVFYSVSPLGGDLS